MDWQTYETITKSIYEALGREAGVKIEGFGKDCKVKGKTDVLHQIDVLTSHSDGIHTYKTAIECKYWKDTVNKDIVMKVLAIIEDTNINKGVVVSRKGFTDDAIKFARDKNIGLVELREMEEKDWEGRPRLISLKSEGRRPNISNVFINPVEPTELEQEEIVLAAVKVILHTGEERPFTDYMSLFHKELHTQEVNSPYMLSFIVKGGRIFNSHTNKSMTIHGISFKGTLTVIEGLRFHPIDEIWLIMKSIFEDRSFTIRKSGLIQEDKKH